MRKLSSGARRVLLVDEATSSRRVAQTLLDNAGLHVEAAHDEARAIALCRRQMLFDFILVDLDTAAFDGFETAAAIRRLGAVQSGRAPILASSVRTGAEVLARANAAGICGCIAKPYDPSCFMLDLRLTLDREFPELDCIALPVWNRGSYEGLVDRLGAARMATHLELFRAKLQDVKIEIDNDLEDESKLVWRAHELVTSAGFLGFEDLTAVSRRTQSVRVACTVRELSRDFMAAIARAIAALPPAVGQWASKRSMATFG